MAGGATSPPPHCFREAKRPFDCGAACGGVNLDARDGLGSKLVRPGMRRKEAVQIETQARVTQDRSPSHLPATAWPRQMLAVMYATQHHLPMGVGRGDYDQPSAGTAPSGHKEVKVRDNLCLAGLIPVGTI